MVHNLTVFTIDLMNIMICLYNSGKISYEDFLKHSGMKVKFLRDNTDSVYFDKQDTVQSILKEYDRIVSSKLLNYQ